MRSLECPYPVCRYDTPRGLGQIKSQAMGEKIRRAIQANPDASQKELAALCGCSTRTIYRLKAGEKNGGQDHAKRRTKVH